MIRSFQQPAEQVMSGFRSPADDYLEGRLNIADVLVVDPHCTFYFRMDSPAMSSFGIAPGDLLIADRSLKAVHDAIVIAIVDDMLYCRCYETNNNQPLLKGDTDTIKPNNGGQLQVWGVVTSLCRNVLPGGLKKGRYKNVCTM